MCGIKYLFVTNGYFFNFRIQRDRLSGAVIQGGRLSGAVIQGDRLSGAVIQGDRLSGAVIQGDRLSGAVIMTESKLGFFRLYRLFTITRIKLS